MEGPHLHAWAEIRIPCLQLTLNPKKPVAVKKTYEPVVIQKSHHHFRRRFRPGRKNWLDKLAP
jgi:hypothetical protein